MEEGFEFSTKNRQDEEYSTQLFGFSGRDVFESVNDDIVPRVIENASKSLKECLAQNFKTESQLAMISVASNELIKKSNTSSVEPLHQLKAVLDGYFQIPSNVLLPEDGVQRNQYTDDEYEKINEEIKDLQARAQRAILLEKILEDEMSQAVKLVEEEDLNFSKTVLKDSEEIQWLQTAHDKVKQVHKSINTLKDTDNEALSKFQQGNM